MTQQAIPTGQSWPSSRQIAEDEHQPDAGADQRNGEGQEQVDLDRLLEAHAIFGQRDAGQRADRNGERACRPSAT